MFDVNKYLFKNRLAPNLRASNDLPGQIEWATFFEAIGEHFVDHRLRAVAACIEQIRFFAHDWKSRDPDEFFGVLPRIQVFIILQHLVDFEFSASTFECLTVSTISYMIAHNLLTYLACLESETMHIVNDRKPR